MQPMCHLAKGSPEDDGGEVCSAMVPLKGLSGSMIPQESPRV